MFGNYKTAKNIATIEEGVFAGTIIGGAIVRSINIAIDYLEDLYNGLTTESIPVIMENIDGNIRYELLGGHDRFLAASLVSEDLELSCKVIQLPNGMRIEEFMEIANKTPGVFYKNWKGDLKLNKDMFIETS